MKAWMRRVSRPAGLLLAAAAAAALPLHFARAATCALPHEQAALGTRILQTDLMVAALTCGERDRYNAFVHKFEAELVAHGRALRQYFGRAYGGAANAEINRFVTRLANEASARSLVDGTAAYCAAASSLFGEVLAIDPGELRAFVARRSASANHGIRSCAVKASSAKPQ